MPEDLSWVPPGVDTGKASVARVYDYWLGGTHNFQADRDAARALIAVGPWARDFARENRAFLVRAIRFLAAGGVRQFLDIGSGIPTQGNVHEIAQAVAPQARVVYADIDPVAVAHSKAILMGNPVAGVIQADLRDPKRILASREVRRLLDFRQPIGLLLGAVLHFITDDEDPWQIVRSLLEAMVPGSYLVISHGSTEGMPAELTAVYEHAYSQTVAATGTFRSRAAVERFFDGLELLPPGVVPLPEWRPDPPADTGDRERLWFLAGVGRKP